MVLVVLFGLGAGVTLAGVAGARRTASANDAILRAANSAELITSFQTAHPAEILAQLERIPGVDGVSILIGFGGRLEGIDQPASTLYFQGMWTDPPTVDRPIVTAGRLPSGPNEMLLNEGAAERTGLRPGGTATLALVDPTSFGGSEQLTRSDMVVVGIGLLAEEVIEDELGVRPLVLFSRAFTETHLSYQVYGAVGLSLARGDVSGVAAGLPAVQDGNGRSGMVIERLRDDDRARVQTAMRPLLGTLVGFTALAGTATVVVTAQATSRMVRRRRTDDRALTAIGCTRRQLAAADLGCAFTVAAGGAAMALVLAAFASPLFPVGPARRVRGVVGGADVDSVALGVGAAALVGALLVLVGVSVLRQRTGRTTGERGWAPRPLARHPAGLVGLRMATARTGASTTIAGVAAGLATVLATLTFTGALDGLARDADLVGMSWDVVARETFTDIDAPSVLSTAQGDPRVRRVTGLGYTNGTLNGAQLPGAQVTALLGDPWPPVSAGRAPRTSREILVGRATLETLGLHVGDEVQLTLSRNAGLGPGPEPKPVTVTVVGSAVAPAVGLAGVGTPRLGHGFVLSAETVEAIVGEGSVTPFVYLFDLAPGADPKALIDRFPDGLPDSSGKPTEWYTSAVPAEVRQAKDARPVIWLGVAALAVTVVATIGHSLLGFVRHRRRDYAVLKALGFTPGQVRATVLWQGGAVLGVALLAALPIGIAGGRWLWIAFAEGLGILVRPVIPLTLLGTAVVLTVVVIQSAALVPATLARRTAPGQALHAA